MSLIPSRSDKCKGAMLGTAIGDALGWPNEPQAKNRKKTQKENDVFVKWIRNNRTPFWYDETIFPGEYSDDTQMTLSVARSIITNNWEMFLMEKELPFWLTYERGGGGALLRAAKWYQNNKLPLWKSNMKNEYFNAGGNGAVMRILPHVIASANDCDVDKLMQDIVKNTLITHGHPRAFLGALCYGYILNYLLNKETVLQYGELVNAAIEGENLWGKSPDNFIPQEWLKTATDYGYTFFNEWRNTKARMLGQLKFIKTSLERGLTVNDKEVMVQLGCFDRIGGAGDVATLTAIYLASKYANNPVLGIKVPAFSFGIDTDTIASITGGMVGMINGVNWIPLEWSLVQDRECLTHIVDLILIPGKSDDAKEKINVSGLEEGWQNTPIGKMKLIEINETLKLKNGTLTIKKYKSLLGQTLYLKEFKSNLFDTNTIENIPSKNNQMNYSRAFELKYDDIKTLIYDSNFKKNITFGKVLKIINCLIEKSKSYEDIAKEFNVEISFVYTINNFIKNKK